MKTTTSETILLRDPLVSPSADEIKHALGTSYPVYESVIENITTPKFGLILKWHYYNDGKAWLCKLEHKKKTVCWLSVWKGYFKIGFYFTGKTAAGIDELTIDPIIKEHFRNTKTLGKLIPLALEIRNKKQLADLLLIIQYKMNLK